MKPVSGERLCHALEQQGWVLARVNGSHHIYRHPTTGKVVVLPVHGNHDLKPGTQRGVMRDAGLTDDDV